VVEIEGGRKDGKMSSLTSESRVPLQPLFESSRNLSQRSNTKTCFLYIVYRGSDGATMTGSRADQRILVQLNAAVFERVIVFFAFSMKELLHLCSIHARNNVPRLLFSYDGPKNTFQGLLTRPWPEPQDLGCNR
jgi:hypothetical protein